jgi:hypothetical protein
MGTHISKVKSVDLDTWTDEQLQSVLKWGNARANKYWESKLAPGHVPSEAKIENFIRTKYESKRWVMDGPMPDPSTLEADDDDIVSGQTSQDNYSGWRLMKGVAVEEGPGEGPDRTLRIATSSPGLQPAASSPATSTAAAYHRSIWRRSRSSATEHWTANLSERASQGRGSSTETEQGRRFIAGIGLPWWIVFCGTFSSV